MATLEEERLSRELRALLHEANNFLCLCTVQAELALELGDEHRARRALVTILERARETAAELGAVSRRVGIGQPSTSHDSPDGAESR